jgi:hypothetical protein
MKRFVIITLSIVIVILLLRNVTVFSQIITTVTDIFKQSFQATVKLGEK